MKVKNKPQLHCIKHNRILIGKDKCVDCQSQIEKALSIEWLKLKKSIQDDERKKIAKELNKLLRYNYDKQFGTYDYEGFAESVIDWISQNDDNVMTI